MVGKCSPEFDMIAITLCYNNRDSGVQEAAAPSRLSLEVNTSHHLISVEVLYHLTRSFFKIKICIS